MLVVVAAAAGVVVYAVGVDVVDGYDVIVTGVGGSGAVWWCCGGDGVGDCESECLFGGAVVRELRCRTAEAVSHLQASQSSSRAACYL